CDRSRLVCTLSFTGARPTANELATLLYVTSAQEPKYNHDTQCYWFAATVFDALNILYDGAKQDPTPHQGDGEEVCAKYRGARAALAEEIEQGSHEKEGQREREQREATEQERQKEREQRQEAEERARATQEEIAKLLQEVEVLKRAVASTQQA
ncbi:hypothetical protein F5J12DRAFT_867541, partial [Pisolithus orientalis]|uniref:uncharacterized protein n=1 Tax=Pisolithus orientalis TaxID=936130 RepID=UPI0022257BE9